MKSFKVGRLSQNAGRGFTLTEVLVAVLIVGIIAGLVLPAVVSKFQQTVFDHAYNREIQSIQNALEALPLKENKTSFFETMMYQDSESENYDESSKKFMKEYMKIVHMCDTGSDCFAPKYYEYKNKDKIIYTPEFDGACAKLRNGMSLCLKPQRGGEGVSGIIDLNGDKNPNVYGLDLREFKLEPKTQLGRNIQTEAVLSYDFDPIKPTVETDPCEGYTCGCGDLPDCPPVCSESPYSWDVSCCTANSDTITSATHPCCSFDEFKDNESCLTTKIAELSFKCFGYDYSGRPNPDVPSTCSFNGSNVPISEVFSFSSNIVSGTAQSTNGTISQEYQFVMKKSTGNYIKNMSIKGQNHTYTCSHTYTSVPNKDYCSGGSCLPRHDTRLYMEYEYKADRTGRFIRYTGKAACYVYGDDYEYIRGSSGHPI